VRAVPLGIVLGNQWLAWWWASFFGSFAILQIVGIKFCLSLESLTKKRKFGGAPKTFKGLPFMEMLFWRIQAGGRQ
jgi:hypothetical protein